MNDLMRNCLAVLLIGYLTTACSTGTSKNNVTPKDNVTPKVNVATDNRYIEIIDTRANAYIASSAKVVELASGFKWTEGPLWLEENHTVLFSDIPNNKIFQYSHEKGLSEYLDKSGATGLFEGDNLQGSNGLLLNKAGQLVLLQQGDRRVAIMDSTLDKPKSKFITLAGAYKGMRLNSPNDGVYDSQGNLYFTDPAYGLTDRLNDVRKALPFQGVYRLSAEGELSLLDKDIKFPNGIGVSPDDKTLYVAVSDEQQPVWFAYDLSTKGAASHKRIFHDATATKLASGTLPNAMKSMGVPDGMAVHSSGVIFATGPGGVWLLSDKGELLAKIYTGKLTANCALSFDEKQLFITAHDTLFMVDLN